MVPKNVSFLLLQDVLSDDELRLIHASSCSMPHRHLLILGEKVHSKLFRFQVGDLGIHDTAPMGVSARLYCG